MPGLSESSGDAFFEAFDALVEGASGLDKGQGVSEDPQAYADIRDLRRSVQQSLSPDDSSLT